MSIKRIRRPSPPGEILKAHFMEPRNITVVALADAVGRSRKHISQLVHGHVALEADMAERLAAVLGTTPAFWVNLQKAVDLHDARAKLQSSAWQPTKRWTAETIVN